MEHIEAELCERCKKQAKGRLFRMTEELKIAMLELQEANLIKNEFLSRISHEMLTPLTAIRGMVRVIMQSRVLADIKDEVYAIDRASSQLSTMINDLLDLSGDGYGEFELQESEFSFEDAFWTSASKVRSDLMAKNHKLNVELNPSVLRTFIGDEKRLAQVITHLLANAVKFTPEKGEISFSANVQSEDADNATLRIIITDNGIGISKQQQRKIFDIFTQVDESLTRKYGGVGLGLPLAEYIVSLMGGKIKVESELGAGSTFSFTCKLKKAEAPLTHSQ